MTAFLFLFKANSQISSNEVYHVVKTLHAGPFPPIFTVFGDLVYIVLLFTSTASIISIALTIHVKGCIVFSPFLFYVL